MKHGIDEPRDLLPYDEFMELAHERLHFKDLCAVNDNQRCIGSYCANDYTCHGCLIGYKESHDHQVRSIENKRGR